MNKPQLLSYADYGTMYTVNVLINNKVYKYEAPTSREIERICNFKYFGFKALNKLKKLAKLIEE